MKIISKNLILKISICLLAMGFLSCELDPTSVKSISILNSKMDSLSAQTSNSLLSNHFQSIKKVIGSEKSISKKESEILLKLLDSFDNDTLANPADLQSYLDRKRTMILAWTSPTDNKTSFAWLRLPKHWDPNKAYPLYVQLHGYWDVADEAISFMSYTFTHPPSTTTAFEDGYFLSPWGRGNLWYEGISKTDIWESMAHIEEKLKIDPSRKYLCGHSMGGYGAWQIAQESDSIWAAIGIHSGALYYNSNLVTESQANNLKETPSYFVWGKEEKEDYHLINNKAIELLKNAGNNNVKDTLFNGGHDYNERDVEIMYEWMRQFSKQ